MRVLSKARISFATSSCLREAGISVFCSVPREWVRVRVRVRIRIRVRFRIKVGVRVRIRVRSRFRIRVRVKIMDSVRLIFRVRA